NDLAGVAAEHEDPCWRARGHKEPMIRGIERHGEIVPRTGKNPAGKHLERNAVHYGDMMRTRHINEYACSARFQLKGLGVALQPDVTHAFVRCRVDDAQRSGPVTHIDQLGRGIIPHVVRVVAKVDAIEELQGGSIEDLAHATLAVGYEDLV